MGGLSLVAIGVAVGLNNFAVALALGSMGQEERRWRIATVFFCFEFTIPLVGLLLGAFASGILAGAGRWIGAALLILLGLVAARPAGFDEAWRERLVLKTTSWRGLAGLAAGLTLDNLLVGFALGLEDARPLLLATVIATFATAFTLIGLRLGTVASRVDERRAQVFAGLLLIVLGVGIGLGAFG